MSVYKKQEIVFIDKTGSNLQDTMRTNGYSMKSQKAQKFILNEEHNCCKVNVKNYT